MSHKLSPVINANRAFNGTLITLINRKNRAPIPINSIFGIRRANKYNWITGPAAFANIVENPPKTPAPNPNPLDSANRSNDIGFNRLIACTPTINNTHPPITRRAV